MAEAGVVRGVVALELAGGQPPARDALGPEPGGELATRVGRDLARLVDGVVDLDLVGPQTVLGLYGKTLLLWKSLEPVATETGNTVNPTTTFDEAAR